VRVQIVDPSANTPPYDHALSSALAAAGAEVELVTSRFVHGPRPEPNGYRLDESFYRLSTRLAPSSTSARRVLRLAEHVPDMLRYRRRSRAADVVHFQWIAFDWLDRYLLPSRPTVVTVHNVDPRRLPFGAFKVEAGVARRADALVVRSLDSGQIEDRLRGKSSAEARSLLEGLNTLAGSPRVEINPAWAPRAYRVEVTVSAPK